MRGLSGCVAAVNGGDALVADEVPWSSRRAAGVSVLRKVYATRVRPQISFGSGTVSHACR